MRARLPPPPRPQAVTRRGRGLLAGLLLVLLALVAWRVLREDAPIDGVDPSVEGLPDPVRRPRLAAPAAPTEVPGPTPGRRPPSRGLRIDLAALGGETRFQRRLALGSEVERLEVEWREGRLPTEDALALLRSGRRGFLLLDHFLGYDLAHGASSGHVAGLFRYLTKPARTSQALRLATLAPPTGAFGAGARLRVWSTGEEVPAAHLEDADALLARLARVVGEEERGGYDVLASADMGADVFPTLRDVPWPIAVAGFYTPVDDCCVVGTRYDDPFRRILLKHELAHAWHHRWIPEWRSRFLAEGLAEYLARLESPDERLEVPPRRLADECAALLAVAAGLEAAGASFGDLRFAGLIAASPAEFYGLGAFGYLVALTSVACVGPETVEEALRARSEARLAEAVGALSWADLLAFARAHGPSGDLKDAVVIGDLAELEGTEAGGPRPPAPVPAANVLRRLGAVLPRGVPPSVFEALLSTPREAAAQEVGHVSDVLSWLVADETLVFATDASPALDGAFRFAGAPEEGPARLAARPLDVGSRRDFVLALLGEMTRLRGGRSPWSVALGPEVAPFVAPDLPRLPSFAAAPLPGWLALHAPRASLLVVVASREWIPGLAPPRPPDEASPTVAFLERLSASGIRPRAVLVVDLSDGEGGARVIADAFAAHFGGRHHVAYWNPQRPLR